ncbi:ribosome production factor 1-like, partial [Centruroides sculpturatus]|uniref:ribosome production factor 1-like n=1 Tax=Centruroides sculpturatus TaxID=218467 RepID=UPI000C6E5E22
APPKQEPRTIENTREPDETFVDGEDEELLKAPPKQEPRTIENTREPDETFVDGEDEEIQYDLDTDEMSNYFNRDVVPKILITTAEKPHTKTLLFARELRQTIPNAHLHWRRKFSIKNLIKMAIKKEFTDIIVINEDKRNPSILLSIVYNYCLICYNSI